MGEHVEVQSLVDSHEHPFVVIGKYYRVIAVNRAYTDAFNTTAAAAVGQPCFKVLHRRERPCHELGAECPYLECLVTQTPCTRLHTHRDAAGETRWVRVTMHPIRGIDGDLYVGESMYEIAPSDGAIVMDEPRPVGRSPVFLRTMEQLEQAAKTDAPVLLMGETGTGKELAARFVHQYSQRSRNPCVAVDCTVITDGLFESEMFGHERGAFTGSVHAKQGLFEIANEGTIFLDEIGEASPSMQAKLLRVLETGEFRRVGGNRMIRASPRLICATNRHLWKCVEAKEFREDLYYRIACFCIRVPSLRERMEDIPVLAEALLRRIGLRDNRGYRLSDGAIEVLLAYRYPGNVRELRNILQVAVGRLQVGQHGVIGADAVAGARHMHEHGGRQVAPERGDDWRYGAEVVERSIGLPLPPPTSERTGVRKPIYAPSIERLEARHIAHLLHAHRGNRRQVALALGISERTLYRKLAQYDLK